MEERLTAAVEEVVRALEQGETLSESDLRTRYADCWEEVVEALDLQRVLGRSRAVPERVGPYCVLRELGSGGMGTVYLARAPQQAGDAAELVAVKIIRPDAAGSPRATARFLREAEIGSRVRHPNVVGIRDSGIAVSGGEQTTYLVMDYVRGQSLRQLQAEIGRVPEELCRQIARDVAAGLAAIHAAGAVHRDLKPANVLITDDHLVKVTDLGAAVLLDASRRLSQPGAFVGSLLYAAPEQLMDSREGVDPRWDLYALGVMLQELVTGRHPLAGGGGVEEPPVSAFFESLIGALSAADPADRPASAAAVVDILDAGEAGLWWQQRASAFVASSRSAAPRLAVSREVEVHGRDVELATLSAALEAVSAGSGQVVLVTGEPGVGKTRLVDEFVRREWSNGRRFAFLGAAYGPLAPATIDPWLKAFGDLLGPAITAADLRSRLDVSADTAEAVAALLRVDGRPEDAPRSAQSLQALVVTLARLLGEGRPAVVFVDDLHWAPPSALDLFLAVARETASRPVLLIGATRGRPDERWMGALRGTSSADHLPLQRLGPRDLADLLSELFGSDRIDGELAMRLARRSDGNPFFAIETVRSLRARGLVSRASDGTWSSSGTSSVLPLPESVQDLVESRLAVLADDDRRLLEVASCFGKRFDPTVIADALGEPRVPVLRRLSRLERAHRIVRADGRMFAFDHDQTRDNLYDAQPESLRMEYHAQLAGALTPRKGADVAPEVCRHLVLAGRAVETVEWLPQAVRRLEDRGRRAQVVELLTAVLDVPGALRGGSRVAWLLRLADAHSWLAQLDQERAALAAARDALRGPGTDAVLGYISVREARNLYRAGRTRPARRSAREALRRCRDRGDFAGMSRAAEILSSVAERRGRLDLGEGRARQALEAARHCEDRACEVDALIRLGTIRQLQGDYPGAHETAVLALAIAEQQGLPRRAARLMGNVGNALALQGRYREARDWMRRGIRRAHALCDLSTEIRQTGNLVTVSDWLGDDRASLDVVERLVALARATDDVTQVADSLARYARVLKRFGFAERAREAHMEALQLFRRTQDVAGEVGELVSMANAEEVRGRYVAALEMYDQALAGATALGQPRLVCEVNLFSGQLMAAAGDPQEGDRRISVAIELAREHGWLPILTVALADRALRHPDETPEAERTFHDQVSYLETPETINASASLWRATGKSSYLDRARDAIHLMLDHAPTEAARDGLRRIPLYRDLLAAAAEPRSTECGVSKTT